MKYLVSLNSVAFGRCVLTSQTVQTKGLAKGNGQFSGSDGSKRLKTFQREKNDSQEGKELIEFSFHGSLYVSGAMEDSNSAALECPQSP